MLMLCLFGPKFCSKQVGVQLTSRAALSIVSAPRPGANWALESLPLSAGTYVICSGGTWQSIPSTVQPKSPAVRVNELWSWSAMLVLALERSKDTVDTKSTDVCLFFAPFFSAAPASD